MNTPKVSILIPIYNVDKYLEQCLSSVVDQSINDIEIICVNDGSTDRSLEIIKNFKNYDERIILIDKENSGYGDSLNRALDCARGEFIGIVEPDDFIAKDMIKTLYTYAKNNNLDVVKSEYNLYWTDKPVKKHSFFECGISKDKINTVICPQKDCVNVGHIPPSIWSALYKREFINDNNIRFLTTPGASYQDTGFSFKVWLKSKRVMLIDYYGYNYRQDNENSSVKIANKEKINALNIEYGEIIKFAKENNCNKEFMKVVFDGLYGAVRWNITRMDRKYISEYIKEEKKIFPELFDDSINYTLNNKSCFEKLFYYSIKNENIIVLYFVILLTTLKRKYL